MVNHRTATKMVFKLQEKRVVSLRHVGQICIRVQAQSRQYRALRASNDDFLGGRSFAMHQSGFAKFTQGIDGSEDVVFVLSTGLLPSHPG
jgi:hypothetical protein